MADVLRELSDLTDAELDEFATAALTYLRELDNNFDGAYELRALVELANRIGVTALETEIG